ncbi:MAG: hypothetical protein O3B74_06110 [Proteobacteria bacterium]|nr:hypothetical protein [Pseudomonadota bacterium]
MKTLVLSLLMLGLASFAGVAQAGSGCMGTFHDQTAETPPPPPAPDPTT